MFIIPPLARSLARSARLSNLLPLAHARALPSPPLPLCSCSVAVAWVLLRCDNIDVLLIVSRMRRGAALFRSSFLYLIEKIRAAPASVACPPPPPSRCLASSLCCVAARMHPCIVAHVRTSARPSAHPHTRTTRIQGSNLQGAAQGLRRREGGRSIHAYACMHVHACTPTDRTLHTYIHRATKGSRRQHSPRCPRDTDTSTLNLSANTKTTCLTLNLNPKPEK